MYSPSSGMSMVDHGFRIHPEASPLCIRPCGGPDVSRAYPILDEGNFISDNCTADNLGCGGR
jgi:hypothetical protein